MSKEGADKNSPEEALASAQSLLATISAIKEQATAALAATEEANRKANSESGFAYNAKQNSEEHAKTIAQLRGAVEADLAWLASTKKDALESGQFVANTKATAENDARLITEAKTASSSEAAATHAAKEKADAFLAAIEQAKSNAESASKTAIENEATVAKAKASAEAGSESIHELETQTVAEAASTKKDLASITSSEADAKSLLNSITEIVAEVKSTYESVKQYEASLQKLTDEFSNMHKKIEGLLPGATSAGLASAFNFQKERFKNPQRNWLLTFIAAIAMLAASAFIGWPSAEDQKHWDYILRHLAAHLPLAAPLVWLAIYAGRNYMLALRVQEEYAFKEAISTTFEGYKREMAGISGNGNGPQPLLTLCENVIRALGQRPGRIYEGHHEDITPITPIAKAVTAFASEKIGGGKKTAPE